MRVIPGKCHCGNINYDFTWPTASGLIPARACGCSYCQKHGAAWTSHPKGKLELRFQDPNAVQHYRFGHHTADFNVCGCCGIVVFASVAIDDRLYTVLNVNTFENVEPDELNSDTTNFEDESKSQRLARRLRNWTPTSCMPT